jgi:N-acetylglucosaminyl-diphospho-decaprenol L-rhamnosyltransferase
MSGLQHVGGGPCGVSVVLITRNRVEELVSCLRRLAALTDVVQTIVVDNNSTAKDAGVIKRLFPNVKLILLPYNAEAYGRTLGMQAASTPVAAFCDDDSGWQSGALTQAVALFAEYPRLGLVPAALYVGADEHLDPTSTLMAKSQPPRKGKPGIPNTGFLACGSVLRRDAYLSVGGFNPRLGLGGEEALLAIDLLSSGWDVQYVPHVKAVHFPSLLRATHRIG